MPPPSTPGGGAPASAGQGSGAATSAIPPLPPGAFTNINISTASLPGDYTNGGSPGSTPSSLTAGMDPAAQAAHAANERITAVLSFEDSFWGATVDDPAQGVKRLYDIISRHLQEIDLVVQAIRHRITLEDSVNLRTQEFARSLMAVVSFRSAAQAMQGPLGPTGSFVVPATVATHSPYGILAAPLAASTPPPQPFEPPVSSDDWGGGGATPPPSPPVQIRPEAAADGLLSLGAKGRQNSGSFRAVMAGDTPGGGNTADDESSLLPALRDWGRLLLETTQFRRRHSDTLLLASLTPLQSFVAQHRKLMEKKKAEVDTHLKAFAKHQADVRTKQTAYYAKAKAHAQAAADESARRGFQQPTSTWSGEPLHVWTKREADAARAEYQGAIDAAEPVRSALEFHITDFLMWAQETEFYRLRVAREAFLALEAAQLYTIDSEARIWTVDPDLDDSAAATALAAGSASSSSASSVSTEGFGSMTRLVTPSPARGVENIAVRLRTGTRRPQPLLFRPFTAGGGVSGSGDGELAVPRQAFGISLEALARATDDPIPAVVRKCVAALHDHQSKGRLHSGIDAWIRPNPDLPSVHLLRVELNASLAGMKVPQSRLQRESPAVIAGVLKLFFLELPTSMCTHDIYDVLKIVYSASDSVGVPEDPEVRIKSISSLLTTLPPSHYETLKIFAGLMHEVVRDLGAFDKRIKRLAYSIAPCIIRPKEETSATLADEHPFLLTVDLLMHFPDLFGGPLPLSYFESPPTPPASPEPDEDYYDVNGMRTTADRSAANGGVPLGFRVAKSTLNLRDPSAAPAAAAAVGEAAAAAAAAASSSWRGLVKSVSTLNIRPSAATGSSPAAPVTAATTTDRGPQSSWFAWSGAPIVDPVVYAAFEATASPQASPPSPLRRPRAATMATPSFSSFSSTAAAAAAAAAAGSAFAEDPRLHGLAGELHATTGSPHACPWADCDAEFADPDALADHVANTHTSLARARAAAAAGGSGTGTPAVLPVEDSQHVAVGAAAPDDGMPDARSLRVEE
ncbi:hypothetical protein HK405_007240 [Cladochytrium tenue]|nr:hypothetical protein HK405_007240 [Cladochytrium tenue]